MLLPALFHWSPVERRAAIRATGLLPFSKPSVCTGDHAFAYVCLSPTPSSAWGLSGDMNWVTDIEEWDLWQVRLADGDEVHTRGDFGPVIREVRVYNAIPPDRIWWVAQRSCPPTAERLA